MAAWIWGIGIDLADVLPPSVDVVALSCWLYLTWAPAAIWVVRVNRVPSPAVWPLLPVIALILYIKDAFSSAERRDGSFKFILGWTGMIALPFALFVVSSVLREEYPSISRTLLAFGSLIVAVVIGVIAIFLVIPFLAGRPLRSKIYRFGFAVRNARALTAHELAAQVAKFRSGDDAAPFLRRIRERHQWEVSEASLAIFTQLSIAAKSISSAIRIDEFEEALARSDLPAILREAWGAKWKLWRWEYFPLDRESFAGPFLDEVTLLLEATAAGLASQRAYFPTSTGSESNPGET